MSVVINLEAERLLRSYDKIASAIVNYIIDMDLAWEIEIARRIYFGKYIDAIDNDNPDFKSYKPFIQWLIFSYKLHDGHSLIDCIYNNYIDIISNSDKDALLSLKNTQESLYKVYAVEDNRVLVKDVFTNESIYVWDNLLVSNTKRYCGIFMRTVSINNKNIPIPGYSIMSNSFLKDIIGYIMSRYKEFQKFNKSVPINNFINSHSLMIHRYLLYFDI